MLTGGMAPVQGSGELRPLHRFLKKGTKIYKILIQTFILKNYSSILNTVGLSVKIVLNGLNVSL
jgi:hypothetical protein